MFVCRLSPIEVESAIRYWQNIDIENEYSRANAFRHALSNNRRKKT